MQRRHTNWYLAVINLFAFDCIRPWSSILIQETVNQEGRVYQDIYSVTQLYSIAIRIQVLMLIGTSIYLRISNYTMIHCCCGRCVHVYIDTYIAMLFYYH